MRIVVALGGNALLRRGEPAEAATQRAHVLEAASAARRTRPRDELVITHGNGPQVGLLALEAEAYEDVAPYPLDVLGAETQGMIGYLLAQALRSQLAGHDVVAVLTQVLVDPDDPAFCARRSRSAPSTRSVDARRLAESRWSVARDGQYFRRVVASPEPQAIVELAGDRPALRRRGASSSAPAAAASPSSPTGGLHGVDAVIDKDLTAALLAEQLGADRLIMLTDVPYVERDWGTPRRLADRAATPAELRQLSFAPDRWARRSRLPAASSSAPAAKPSSPRCRISKQLPPATPEPASSPRSQSRFRSSPRAVRSSADGVGGGRDYRRKQ